MSSSAPKCKHTHRKITAGWPMCSKLLQFLPIMKMSCSQLLARLRKKDPLQLARGIYWFFCLSQYSTSTFLLQLRSAQFRPSLNRYTAKSVCHFYSVTKLPVLWAVAAESCLLLVCVFRQYFQRWLYVPVDLNVAFFVWSHSDFTGVLGSLKRFMLHYSEN